MAKYMYTTSGGKPDDKFDIEGVQKGSAELRESDMPNQKAMRYADPKQYGQFPKAGAGRGGQGGPTAKELADYERKQNAGIFTEGKKMPPSPREMKKGGMTASKRADGIATKGKTRGTMITMKGGGYAC
jgi:hypothetical protein